MISRQITGQWSLISESYQVPSNSFESCTIVQLKNYQRFLLLYPLVNYLSICQLRFLPRCVYFIGNFFEQVMGMIYYVEESNWGVFPFLYPNRQRIYGRGESYEWTFSKIKKIFTCKAK